MHSYGVLYLHGFLSSGKSEKGQWFHRQVESWDSNLITKWLNPTYPISRLEATLETIEEEIQDCLQLCGTKWILAGSSMGGFYAQFYAHKYHLPYIMINPALNPEYVFRVNLGEHTNPATGENVTIDEAYIEKLQACKIAQPDRALPTLLLIDQDDEVIDINYALKQHQTSNNNISRTVVYKGGDHSFIHLEEAWKEIQSFVNAIEESSQ
jgi:predicted esterase YcpF (UPF0227 family)